VSISLSSKIGFREANFKLSGGYFLPGKTALTNASRRTIGHRKDLHQIPGASDPEVTRYDPGSPAVKGARTPEGQTLSGSLKTQGLKRPGSSDGVENHPHFFAAKYRTHAYLKEVI